MVQKSTTAYGAFIDIGATKDGLVHISQLSVSPSSIALCVLCYAELTVSREVKGGRYAPEQR